MKRTINLITAFFILIFSFGPSMAEDTIKVLIHEDTIAPAPSKDAKDIGSLNGKLFLNGKHYTGSFEIKKDDNGLQFINSIPFEKYVEGVVASETGMDWEMEALKAQAVISRTYAIFHKLANGEKEFHLTSGVLSQVYKDENKDPLIARAVSETGGEILTYNGSPIESLYHSVCYGKTEVPEEVWGASYPYLKPVECNNKNTPYENWERKFTLEDIEKALNIKDIKDITISSFTSTGRVKTLSIAKTNDEAATEIKATELRKLIGYNKLPSTSFLLTKESNGMVFQGNGWGHGVGLSQWGALEMAREGKDYREILAHYYPGTVIEKRQY
ncbi:MAG: SpoIID/LytB domain-containing protein [Thermodesulfovibrionia bacterium]|nr:SpoIID/LytB domain-containing protein [Thermodesulfovibrionia bacterium]